MERLDAPRPQGHLRPKKTQALDIHSWNTVFLSNHDNPRLVSAFGRRLAANRVPSAKLLATMLFTSKARPSSTRATSSA